ncbi:MULTISPECIES: hypothetical protein [unclassified Oceanobacter]|uniref:hypothetical protein n=1 Tax=unclassified Oceanobacter TaxID=2620260 RepID=UPI0026E245A6|nr:MULTISPECIES: hypothetical protein [unclassified Oceanobacter]MDO6682524.1 hypothetical protein [Oceanobacter sp. 5_MG-2023]MDP2506479.1 hypothetical protein [Oceanobacter sp. 3_MG-2023]MDP2609146.1 hypothetical protein [Oceanobacter sp. 1_MG-2023]MDP2612562.1 hypothetical protein [Oceanobacter sp. 2_MG-2023]
MMLTPHELRSIIHPTLDYMGCYSVATEEQLVALAQAQCRRPLNNHDSTSLYPIDNDLHQQIWDQYLAFNPDQASLIRGLASQRQFLIDPHHELKTNLSYATAIAWAVFIAYPQILANGLERKSAC